MEKWKSASEFNSEVNTCQIDDQVSKKRKFPDNISFKN